MKSPILALAGVAVVTSAAGLLPNVTASAATAPAHATRLIANCESPAYEPRTIDPTCGDGTVGFAHLDWTSWHGHSAHGTGKFSFDDCNPNCAAGTDHTYTGTVHLFRARTPASTGQRVFTRLRVDYTSHGRNYHQVYYPPTTDVVG